MIAPHRSGCVATIPESAAMRNFRETAAQELDRLENSRAAHNLAGKIFPDGSLVMGYQPTINSDIDIVIEYDGSPSSAASYRELLKELGYRFKDTGINVVLQDSRYEEFFTLPRTPHAVEVRLVAGSVVHFAHIGKDVLSAAEISWIGDVRALLQREFPAEYFPCKRTVLELISWRGGALMDLTVNPLLTGEAPGELPTLSDTYLRGLTKLHAWWRAQTLAGHVLDPIHTVDGYGRLVGLPRAPSTIAPAWVNQAELRAVSYLRDPV